MQGLSTAKHHAPGWRCGAGFTLIELLIVVAIIAILAAIAVPNFLEAQVRAKVARVQADMRTMATAIETYTVDHAKPPVRRDKYDDPNPNPALRVVPPGQMKISDPLVPAARIGLQVITTPISYLSSIPSDIFNMPVRALMAPGNGQSDILDYWDPRQLRAFRRNANPIISSTVQEKGWSIVSVGPDQYLGYLGASTPIDYPKEPETLRNTYVWMYEATNGTLSRGNVWRFSADLKQNDIWMR